MFRYFCNQPTSFSSNVPFHTRIPQGLLTNETWKLQRRQAIPRSQPAAFFRPSGFVPERFSQLHGIPLYRLKQTKPYNPCPHTIAAQEYYDFVVINQNRHRLGQWEDGLGWRTYDKYLSRAKVRDHLRGKEIYGCWGDLATNWIALDIDYHGGDPEAFLKRLEILKELPAFFPQVRWAFFLNRDSITGLHIVGLLPKATLLEQVRQNIRKALEYLDEENDGNLGSLEIYPANNHNFRLPYAADRITVTDQWLNKPGEVDLKTNLVQFMAYVKNKQRQAVPLAEVISYIKANIEWKVVKKRRKSPSRKRCGGGSMGKIEPLRGRHLNFLTGVVLGTEKMPENTIGCWAAPALRHLMLVDGLNADQALGKIQEFYQMIPDCAFSDRLSNNNIGELLRTDAYTAKHIAQGNQYQPQPEQSTAIFARVRARCLQLGFVFADPSTWHVLNRRRHFPCDVSDVDFSLSFEDKLAVKDPGAAILKCDVPSVYQAVHRVKAFVTKYPGK